MPEITSLKEGSSAQQDGLNHRAIEDYLKTIWHLSQKNSPVTTSQIAAAQSVKPASATGMIKRLSELNLVNYEKRCGVTLTEDGEQIALEVIRHHRLIELYLIQALGFTWDEVHEEADILEHVISEKLEDRIAAVLDYPQFDPHGAPIPSKDGTLPDLQWRPLTNFGKGDSCVIGRIIANNDSNLLRYLADMELKPGITLIIIDVAPFDGPLTISINGCHHLIGFKVASLILIQG